VELLLQVAKEYGLFVALVVYVIWDSRQREGKYIAIIATLSEEVKERLARIESKLNIKQAVKSDAS